MNEIKKMLLGISIMLVVIAFHLFADDALLTDFLAIVGFILVIQGYCVKNKDGNKEGTYEKM